ncbi:hypothetical protein DL240_05685 [Lujinxingia litoralis]|uniref:PEGA domain-containing protein n=1 Tax=Lujinxingia litoralis TaxID=2211119 RepID=A0A328C7W1_9DELT|nr:hypothetical protein [Lujinxingia litoralis]RAL23650.1 hypothetical protein DL240_05685 [Lujinxingia litoralis]
MKRWLLGLIAALTPVSFAHATEPPAEVVVLRFAERDVDQAVMDQFYTELQTQLEDTGEMTLAPGGEVTIDDLIMMGGCSAPDEACLSGMQDFVAGQRLVYGSVQRAEDVHMFSLYLFDFETGTFLHRVEEQTLKGDDAWIQAGIPAVIEHLLYGRSAQVEVQVEGSATAALSINGRPAGQGSTTLRELPPGEAVIVASLAGGEEFSERVILRRGENPALRFVFAPALGSDAEPVASRGSLLPGVGVAALGVAGLVVGVLGQTQLSALESDAEQLVNGRNALAAEEVSRASELQAQMDRAHTLRVVGFSAGGVALAAGGFLIVRTLGGDTNESQGMSWDVDIRKDRVGASLRLDF